MAGRRVAGDRSGGLDVPGVFLTYLMGLAIGTVLVYPALSDVPTRLGIPSLGVIGRPLVVGVAALFVIVVGWWIVIKFFIFR